MEKERKELLEKIMVSVGEMHRCFATSRDSFLAQFDLSRPQLDLLFYIKKKPATISDLARRFSVTSSAISQMVSQLEKDGYVKRVQDKADKRIAYVEISSQAKSVFRDVRKQFAKHLSVRFVGITNSELRLFLAVIEKMNFDINKELYGKN